MFLLPVQFLFHHLLPTIIALWLLLASCPRGHISLCILLVSTFTLLAREKGAPTAGPLFIKIRKIRGEKTPRRPRRGRRSLEPRRDAVPQPPRSAADQSRRTVGPKEKRPALPVAGVRTRGRALLVRGSLFLPRLFLSRWFSFSFYPRRNSHVSHGAHHRRGQGEFVLPFSPIRSSFFVAGLRFFASICIALASGFRRSPAYGGA